MCRVCWEKAKCSNGIGYMKSKQLLQFAFACQYVYNQALFLVRAMRLAIY